MAARVSEMVGEPKVEEAGKLLSRADNSKLCAWAGVQWACKKNEDRWAIVPPRSDWLSSLNDGTSPSGTLVAGFAVFDGHMGQGAAIECRKSLFDLVAKHYRHLRDAYCRTEAETPETEPECWPPYMDRALIAAFEEADAKIQSLMDDGTTASVVLVKFLPTGQASVKAAWVGDSRVVCAKYLRGCAPALSDVSQDHKADHPEEMARIEKFYENMPWMFDPAVMEDTSVHRGNKAKDALLVLDSTKSLMAASIRSASRSSLANLTVGLEDTGDGQSNGGGSPGSTAAAGGTGRAGSVTGGGGGVDDPGRSIHSIAEDDGEGGPRGANSALRLLRDYRGSFMELPPAGEDAGGAFAADPFLASLATEMAALKTGDGSTTGRRGVSESGAGSQASPAQSVGGSMRDVTAYGGAAGGGEGSGSSAYGGGNGAGAPAARRARRQDGPPPVVTRVSAGGGGRESDKRGSFVCRLRDPKTGALSKPRLFGGDLGTIGMSRSIGDRKAARACIATPEVKTVDIPRGQLVRVLVASDGVWDTVSSAEAEAVASGVASMEGPARSAQEAGLRVVKRAHKSREEAGISPDDITCIVVDIHGGCVEAIARAERGDKPSAGGAPAAGAGGAAGGGGKGPEGGCCSVM